MNISQEVFLISGAVLLALLIVREKLSAQREACRRALLPKEELDALEERERENWKKNENSVFRDHIGDGGR